jgi:hypothetical protein
MSWSFLGFSARPSLEVGRSTRGTSFHSAYSYSLGGSLYTATLNAVKSIPKGATLTLKFAVPAQALGCKSVAKNITHLAISKFGSKQARGAYGCQQANAVGETWALRFNAGEQVESFSVSNVSLPSPPPSGSRS